MLLYNSVAYQSSGWTDRLYARLLYEASVSSLRCIIINYDEVVMGCISWPRSVLSLPVYLPAAVGCAVALATC